TAIKILENILERLHGTRQSLELLLGRRGAVDVLISRPAFLLESGGPRRLSRPITAQGPERSGLAARSGDGFAEAVEGFDLPRVLPIREKRCSHLVVCARHRHRRL